MSPACLNALEDTMAYDRYDTRNDPRDERSRWRDQRPDDRSQGRARGSADEDRGFFERAGDEIASWFGDDDAERRRRHDRTMDEREGYGARSSDYGTNRDYGRDVERERSSRDWNDNRGMFARGGSSERDYNPRWREELGQRERERERGYRPMAGDYGRNSSPESEQFFAASGYGRGEPDRSQSPWGRDEYRRTSRAGTSDRSDRSRHEDPHYSSWRDRHLAELDRDYDDYRREHQSKFESDFGNWRDRRQQKRGMLGQIREHMEVVGSDDEHVGTIDCVAGDRVILTKSDPDSGGVHHSLSCADLDRIEGDRVILDCTADQARQRWRDESRSRALFEREDQGEVGPRVLDRSFEGTYDRR
jgi:hypothetical protein